MGEIAERRRRRAREDATALFEKLHEYSKYHIGSLIQCGLGDWAEGPVLLEKLPPSIFPWMAVDPIHRYAHQAWAAGFRGPIIQGALWNKTGDTLKLGDFRTQTSVHDTEVHLGKFETYTIKLDDAVECCRFIGNHILLWMDTEGCETIILEGAERTLNKTQAIICELKDKPRLPNWPNAESMIATLDSLGFELAFRIRDDGLFIRK